MVGKTCLVEIILFPPVHSHQTFNHSDVRLNEDLKLDVYDNGADKRSCVHTAKQKKIGGLEG